MLDQILSTARDIVIIGKAEKDKVIFAFPFEGEVAEHYFNKTLAKPEEREVDGFNRHWKFNKETRLIEGSSTFLTLKLDEEARLDGLWVPTPEQARFLDKNGKLSNEVYRDYGIAVYSEGEPNQKVAEEIIKQANKELPLVIPFKNLVHRIDKDFPYSVAVSLIGNPTEVKSGKQATSLLNQFYSGDSGACRLSRGRIGDWLADWNRLDSSNADGRVDWLCAEGTRADLVSAYEGLLKRQYDTQEGLLKRQYDTQIQKLTAERDKKQAGFVKSLEALGVN